MAFDAQQLLLVGGKEWKRDHRHRIYIENIASLYGLKWEADPRSGRLINATLDGSPIDTADARELLARLKGVKIWYDLGKREFQWRDAPDIKKIAERVVLAIEKALPSDQTVDPRRVHDYGSTYHVDASREFDEARANGDQQALECARAKLALVKPRPNVLMGKRKRGRISTS
jgi:hypothetical protein